MKSFAQIKERRFTTTARILTGQPLEARITDDKTAGPAWTDCHTTIYMNEALPATNDEREKLIYDRGKLYHEIDHCEFHGKRTLEYAQKLARSANDESTFLNINNALLDGHGEYWGGRKWQGQTPYILATLHALVDVNDPSVFNGLLLFVRLKKWRNAQEAAYWQPYETRILEAITCKSPLRTVDLAFEISNEIHKAQPKQPQYDPPKPEKSEGDKSEEKQEGKGESAESEQEKESEKPVESSQEESGESDSSDEEKRDGEDAGSQETPSNEKSESGESSEGDESENESDSESDAPSSGSGGLIDSDVQEAIDKAVKDAMNDCKRESVDELAEIQQELAEQTPEPQYCPNEEPIAQELAEVLRSIMIERNRVVWTPAKRSGRLNTHRLTNVATGGTFLQQRNRIEGAPKVALCVDCSSSIADYGYAEPLSAAARILNGALWQAGIESLTLTFSGKIDLGSPFNSDGSIRATAIIKKHTFLPPETLHCDGSTPTAEAMESALDWLSDASKSLMVIVTDGQPDNWQDCEKEFAKATTQGCYVVMVTIGDIQLKSNAMCDERKVIENVADLPRILEPTLTAFARG